MHFGIFDHLDKSGAPLGEQYEDRLRLVELYDDAGFHTYHLAEHHSTPLGMAPSPGIFLAAVAQRTQRLRFGPLVYTLSLHHPLRIAEEISMLDNLSGGRLDVGFGRGVSRFEIEYYGVDPDEAPARYQEALDIVLKALATDMLTYKGRFYSFKDTPIEMRPLQKPHPRLFYGAASPETAAWAAPRGIHLVCNAPVGPVKAIFDRYRAEWKALGRAATEMPLLGLNRHCVIAETDAEAEVVAERAYRLWHASFHVLWKRRNARPTHAAYPETFEALQGTGLGIAGSPATVRDFYVRQMAEAGATYALGRFAFGDLSLAESRRSVELFRRHVMPALQSHDGTA